MSARSWWAAKVPPAYTFAYALEKMAEEPLYKDAPSGKNTETHENTEINENTETNENNEDISMTMIQQELFALQDITYRGFQAKLIPNIAPQTVIGVRTPALRSLAKRLYNIPEAAAFLEELPHQYFDENQLHAFLLSGEKDFEKCVTQVDHFLSYVDNWATSDQLSPKVFRKHRDELLPWIRKWLDSGETYRIRFGTGMLMQHYLEEHFTPAYPEAVAVIRSDEYYVNMMRAWYFATALAKQYEAVIPYLEENRLDVWTHNKAIQKCVESRRISPERKDYLRSLKRKNRDKESDQSTGRSLSV